MPNRDGVAILGVFVADVAFTAPRLPAIGETLIGSAFALGPGGKGSNQAVAAARAGARVRFISKIGEDDFGAMARALYAREGIEAILSDPGGLGTGAAFIFVAAGTGDNAIIIYPGAAGALSIADIDAAAGAIAASAVFVTQLEQPWTVAERALALARDAGVTTVFNPAPAESFDERLYALCDYVTPNETEATMLTGVAVDDIESARRAAAVLLAKGAGAALITLGARGALLHDRERSVHVPPFSAGAVAETTGAGDAFNGGFAAALAAGLDPVAAARFASATAGISVTRKGTAPSMPHRREIEALLAANGG
jgi:ribokinase